MNKSALIMMIFGCAAVWGGLIVALLIAIKKGNL
ncbi:MetS family NSS transporter small subunit [Fusobacterium sp. MFO224]